MSKSSRRRPRKRFKRPGEACTVARRPGPVASTQWPGPLYKRGRWASVCVLRGPMRKQKNGASDSMKHAPTYTLTLKPMPDKSDPAGIRRLRWLLKAIGRTYRLRVTRCEPAGDGLAGAPAPGNAPGGDRAATPDGFDVDRKRPTEAESGALTACGNGQGPAAGCGGKPKRNTDT